MKRVVPIPVAIGIAAGVIVGFFLGAMVTRHGESAVVILNATNGPLHKVTVTTDLGLTGWWPFRVPESASYNFAFELQPDTVSLVRLSSHRPTALSVRATTANGKKLSSDQVYINYQGVVFALVSSDGITLQYTTKEMWSFVADAHRDNGKRFIVTADEKLRAFLELQRVTREALRS